MRTDADVVIVGCGIGGGALATALARSGRSVVALERTPSYRDRVRGEYMQPWGVAETQRLGLLDVLVAAGANVITRLIGYDETIAPADAEATATALDAVLEGVPGALSISHPVACEALAAAATQAGAEVVRGVDALDLTLGAHPSVRVSASGRTVDVRCRLVVGADGRESSVRKRAGIPLSSTPARMLGAGLMVEGAHAWPTSTFSIGTEDDRLYFVIPLGDGRARLYLMYDARDDGRLVGADKATRFLDGFALRCVPGSDELRSATPAGPCAVYPMHDSWCDPPVAEGVALIGDAAGFSDPHIGQGLSIAMRDVRLLHDLLVASDDWSPVALQPYCAERAERMHRLRWVNDLMTTLRGEFGAGPRERRRQAVARMRADPELARFRRATLIGPETVPADAFDDAIVDQLLAP